MRAALLLFAFAEIALARNGAVAAEQNLAEDLATVLGSEEFCGLTYDQSAIQAFVEKRVAADDLTFAGDLNTYTGGTKYENRAMSASEKTARCTQIQRVAKSFGFIR
jgi:hypothetical protein